MKIKEYPLAGLIISGTGCMPRAHNSGPNSETGPNQSDSHDNSNAGSEKKPDEPPTHINFEPITKNFLMLGVVPKSNQLLVDPAILEHTERLNKSVPACELHDVSERWKQYWHLYAKCIGVPVMYWAAEEDGFYVSSDGAVVEFANGFLHNPRVEKGVVPMAPHCIELSLQAKGWLTRCIGFSMERAVVLCPRSGHCTSIPP